MKVLHLTLKKKWFDLIKSGDKTEEYREIKQYWIKRLIKPEYQGFLIYSGNMFVDYTHIEFTNGYAKNSPKFTIELKGISIGTGSPEWGAEEGKKYFVLALGKIILNA